MSLENTSHNPKDIFDKNSLKQVVFCSVLMSSIDGHVDEKEWWLIRDFVHRYWKKKYGDFKVFHKEITKDLKNLLNTGSLLKEKLDRLISLLSGFLNEKQKKLLIELVSEVMAADGKMADEELDLYNRFKEKLYNKPDKEVFYH